MAGSFSGTGSQTVTLGSAATGHPNFSGVASSNLTFSESATGHPNFSGVATAVLALAASAPGAPNFTGAATTTVSMVSSASGTVQVSSSATATVNIGSLAVGDPNFAGMVTAPIGLVATSSGVAVMNPTPVTAGLTLTTSVVGFTINPGYVPTYVFFYTGTTAQFSIDEVNINSVLYSFLQAGFIVTSLTPILTSTDVPRFQETYVFTLQRYALPPYQPILMDPP